MTMHSLKQFGVTAALLLMAAVLETKAAMFPLATIEGFAGVQHAALSATCALLAFIFSSVAGGMKDDERPHVRGRATLARAVSIACLIVPISYLGSSFRYENRTAAWEAYQTSPMYAADQRVIADPMADQYEQDEARARLTEPTSSELSIFDFEFWMASFFQIVVITAAGIRLAPPATEAEVKHWRAVAAGKKAAATRKRNAAKRKTRKTFRLIAGGKN